MGKNNCVVGLDIGSGTIRTVIAVPGKDHDALRVVGVGSVASSGIRRGSVVDMEGAARALLESLSRAEGMAGFSVGQAIVALGGHEVFFREASGVVAVGKADGEVLDDDINRVLEQARNSAALSPNQEILHIIPKQYRLDDEKNIKDPLGMSGVRLEVSALVIGDAAQHTKNISRVLEQTSVALEQFVVAPLAASEAVLGTRERELGVALVDIGANTTSLAVFEESDLLHVKILPIGSGHITNDIAIGLRTSIDVAEEVKLRYGSALPDDINPQEDVDLSEMDSSEDGGVSRRHVAEIIEARVEELLRYVDEELKAIGRSGLLPAGIVLTGGGAKLPGLVDLAKETLRLPVQIGYPKPLGGVLDRVDDPEFATAVGLVLWAEANADHISSHSSWMVSGGVRDVMNRTKKFLGKFLP
ncbi:MAG: cell division protein FtsA [Candidatus Moraniibacteriota bacterium]|nr:MAG: cell division protein FtsA [Candidatus Moranbacteria bacterium]